MQNEKIGMISECVGGGIEVELRSGRIYQGLCQGAIPDVADSDRTIVEVDIDKLKKEDGSEKTIPTMDSGIPKGAIERYRRLDDKKYFTEGKRTKKEIERLLHYENEDARVEFKDGNIYRCKILNLVTGGEFIEMEVKDGFSRSEVPIGETSAFRRENIDRYTPI